MIWIMAAPVIVIVCGAIVFVIANEEYEHGYEKGFKAGSKEQP